MVITNVAGAMVIDKFVEAVCAGEPESVTLKVSGVAVTWFEGVPLINPVAALSPNPAGKVPLVSCHEYAPVPPVAARVCEYATPTCPPASEVVVINSGCGVMVSVRLAVAV